MVALAAVPLWWTTTSITRLSLPEGRVKALNDKQLRFSLNISLDTNIPVSVVDNVKEGLAKRILDERLDDIFSVAVSSGLTHNPQAYEVSLNEELSGIHVEGRRLITGPESIPLLTDALANLLLANFGHQDQMVMQYAPRYRLAFSLMNEDAASGDSPLSWDVKTAITRDIQPVLQKLLALHNFTIESQVQFFAPLAFEPVNLANGSFGLSQEQLTVFVNSAEWTLCSPTESTAFIIPQWGSISICNPDKQAVSRLSQRALHPSFSVFRTQLLALLGISPLPIGMTTSDVISDWQLDALLRRRAYENAKGSKETLDSIVSLVDQIEGMPVGKDVTDDVRGALDALDSMYAVARDSPQLALNYSARAFTRVSRAFFNPGMLALLYFPPEHNLAVYTPLLAPVSVPLVAAVFREVSKWRRSRRQSA
ncbi:hypothetical protein EW145_g663 [Phellinidium pouzarii]|uniref:GPI transamidase component PIG-S n=1 Tax=Phellinidium pouzarii TaxID=167371 RepID=A0A4S4LN02_9AGAM|nr:hypothetical protein EW145_g663 [Phellinidium pouzarii]